MSKNGTFIVIEGPDGAGTTYHSGKLSKKLQAEGYDVLLTAEPTDQPIGEFIRTELFSKKRMSSDALQLLFCADRADHVKRVIEPALKAGKVVICDRYIASTLIYGHALGLNVAWLEKVNAPFPKPDLTLIMLPSLEISLKRVLKRDVLDSFENEKFQTKIYAEYVKFAKEHNIKTIDTGGDKEKAASQLLSLVEKVLP